MLTNQYIESIPSNTKRKDLIVMSLQQSLNNAVWKKSHKHSATECREETQLTEDKFLSLD